MKSPQRYITNSAKSECIAKDDIASLAHIN